jgi:hypothetical protein
VSDTETRFLELAALKDGWFYGGGKALSPPGLLWARSVIATLANEINLEPYLYPTPIGNVLAEWSIRGWELTVELVLKEQIISLSALHVELDYEAERETRDAYSAAEFLSALLNKFP